MTTNAIRWLIRRDMLDVLRIEDASFEFPWSDDDFMNCLRQRHCIGMVAEHDHKVVGFMIYELHKGRLQILNFAVAPEARRHSIGTQMVRRLVDKLHQQQRTEITLECRERNLPAQLFFRDRGFRVIDTLPGHYDETDEDAYVMRYRLGRPSRLIDDQSGSAVAS